MSFQKMGFIYIKYIAWNGIADHVVILASLKDFHPVCNIGCAHLYPQQ